MAKLSEIKKNNPEFLIDVVQFFRDNDPTQTGKYVPFMVNVTKEFITTKFMDDLKNKVFKDLFEKISSFDYFCEKNIIKEKDIYAYENFAEIISALKTAEEYQSTKDIKEKQTHLLYEDDDLIVLQPLTFKSSCIYGKNTTWCTTSDGNGTSKYFENYSKGFLIYFCFKKDTINGKKIPNQWRKIAIQVPEGNAKNISVYNQADSDESSMGLLELQEYLPNNFMTQILLPTLKSGMTNEKRAKEKGLKIN